MASITCISCGAEIYKITTPLHCTDCYDKLVAENKRLQNLVERWAERAADELLKRATLEAMRGMQEYRDVALLREALGQLLRCSAYREYGHCGQCEQRARYALNATARPKVGEAP